MPVVSSDNAAIAFMPVVSSDNAAIAFMPVVSSDNAAIANLQNVGDNKAKLEVYVKRIRNQIFFSHAAIVTLFALYG